MQHIQDNTDSTEQNREQHTENSTENKQRTTHNINAQNSAHNFSTYSLDYYHEFAYIKNSNTIELYTISKENI